MVDSNERVLQLAAEVILVQIPLWSIVTKEHQGS